MYAEQEFNLSERQRDGKTLREHLESVVKQGITPKELENLVELPESLSHCWYWFLDLNNTRPQGFGISPISYFEMQAYFHVLQIPVEPWEIEIIKFFDRIALDISQKQQEKEKQKTTKKS